VVDAVSSISSGVGSVLGYRVTPYSARSQVNTTHPIAPLQSQVQNENTGAAPIPDSSPTTQTSVEQQRNRPAEENTKGNAGTSRQQAEALTEEEQRVVAQLKTTDQAVRAHEQAHTAAGGNLVIQGATYSYRTGPDGKRYAVAGEVQIDTSEVPDDPEATAAKASRIIRTALAPADPSSQDRKVAANASAMQMEARMEIARQAYENASQSSPDSSAGFIAAG